MLQVLLFGVCCFVAWPEGFGCLFQALATECWRRGLYCRYSGHFLLFVMAVLR